jgi:hypothetical protein
MLFLFGYAIGLLTAIFIMVVLTYFRRIIEHKINVIEKRIENAGPRPQGFIVEPMEENEVIRQEIIEKNRKMGIDTRLSELM